MIVNDIITALETLAPPLYAEDFDNVGLLVGNRNTQISGVLVTLDTLEIVVDEAIEKNCNLIVSFHPIIFSGLKRLTGETYVERVVLKAIKHEIAIYATHTALDNTIKGVSRTISNQLELKNCEVLLPQPNNIKKLTTYVPVNQAAALREALFEAGAGSIGNYENCSFNFEGQGTFKPNQSANPVVGERGKTHTENEICVSFTFARHLEKRILQALYKSHPYEEVAHEIITVENSHQHIGMGILGDLEKALAEKDFLDYVKDKMHIKQLRHSPFLGKPVKKVAVLGGSGAFAIEAAKKKGVNAFITADLKYHQFYQGENQIIILDIGHYESEKFTKNLLVDFLRKKFPNFAIILAESNTNPVHYL